MEKIQKYFISFVLLICVLCLGQASAQTEIIPKLKDNEGAATFYVTRFLNFSEGELLKTDTKLEPFSDTIMVEVDERTRVCVQKKLSELELEATMLAKLVYREAGGIQSKAEQAGVIWCVLNRVDCEDTYGDTISEVIKAKNQFCWVNKTPVREDLFDLAEDVLTRWLLEKEGYEEVGRTLPNDYFFFAGRKGHNWFRKNYKSSEYWDWSLDDPYTKQNGS